MNLFAAATLPEVPTADQMASWSAPQFIQVLLGFALLAIGAIAIFFIRQMSDNAKELNKQNDSMLAELVKRYDRQDVRYEQQDIRHQARDDKTIETLRLGLADMANAIRGMGPKGTR